MNTYHNINCTFVKSLGVGECDCGLFDALENATPEAIPDEGMPPPPVSEYEDRL